MITDAAEILKAAKDRAATRGPFFKPGQAEQMLERAYNEREAALCLGDATEYNRIDGHIKTILSAMRAEVRLGLRDDPIFSCAVSA